MSGDLISKKLGMFWECPKQELHKCSLRHCEFKRKEYRRITHLQRREIDNKKNRERYHNRYKLNPDLKETNKRKWREYAKRMGRQWQRERSKKYRKPYSSLSISTRSKIRAAYKKWAKKNWDWRVEYARQYRRRKPTFG